MHVHVPQWEVIEVLFKINCWLGVWLTMQNEPFGQPVLLACWSNNQVRRLGRVKSARSGVFPRAGYLGETRDHTSHGANLRPPLASRD